MASRPLIAVVGSCNIDLIAYCDVAPALGQTILGNDFKKGFGGKGANQAVAVARLNGLVEMIGKVGTDAFGEETRRNFEENGVGTKYLFTTDKAPSGVAPITVDAKGNNMIIVVPGANNLLVHSDLENAREVIENAKIVICQLEVPIETTLQALKMAKAKGVFTILNSAPAPPSGLPNEIYQYCDILCPNETEATILSGVEVKDIESQKLLEKGVKNVIVTLGANGSLLVNKEQVVHIPSEKVKAIDTSGAGDCFIGTLAHFLALGKPIEDAILFANRVAAVSVQYYGTQTSYPRLSELPDSIFVTK